MRGVELTRNEVKWLTELARMERVGFTGMFSSRQYLKRDAEKLMRKGFVYQRLLLACDGDGWAREPERYKPGYCLTEDGRKEARRHGKD